MEIKVNLSDEYHVQFYQNDDGNIVISGSVNCDCYDEEVLEVILKPEHVLNLLEESWLLNSLRIVIDKKLESDRKTKEMGGTGMGFVPNKLLGDIMRSHITQKPLIDLLRESNGKIKFTKPKAAEDE